MLPYLSHRQDFSVIDLRKSMPHNPEATGSVGHKQDGSHLRTMQAVSMSAPNDRPYVCFVLVLLCWFSVLSCCIPSLQVFKGRGFADCISDIVERFVSGDIEAALVYCNSGFHRASTSGRQIAAMLNQMLDSDLQIEHRLSLHVFERFGCG